MSHPLVILLEVALWLGGILLSVVLVDFLCEWWDNRNDRK